MKLSRSIVWTSLTASALFLGGCAADGYTADDDYGSPATIDEPAVEVVNEDEIRTAAPAYTPTEFYNVGSSYYYWHPTAYRYVACSTRPAPSFHVRVNTVSYLPPRNRITGV